MEADDTEKKTCRAKSVNSGPLVTERETAREPNKRKSLFMNEAVRSLDLALCRLKKSKLVNGECVTVSNLPDSPPRRTSMDMCMDVCSSYLDVCPSAYSNPDNASMMSMNFSHYELVRNLSSCNCNSDEASSSTNCSTTKTADHSVKDEHLERFFRSAEMWTQRYRGGPSTINLNIPKNKQ